MRIIPPDTLDETDDGSGISEPSSTFTGLRTPGATPPSASFYFTRAPLSLQNSMVDPCLCWAYHDRNAGRRTCFF